MGKLTLITGGARSGKSSYAQRLAEPYARVAYVATARCTDDEMARRIALHQASRPAHFTTHERPTGLVELWRTLDCDAALLDCVTVWLTNELFARQMDWDAPITQQRTAQLEHQLLEQVDALIAAIRSAPFAAILVTNELGMGVVPASQLGRVFRDIAGHANQRLAQAADNAHLMVSGLRITLKGGTADDTVV